MKKRIVCILLAMCCFAGSCVVGAVDLPTRKENVTTYATSRYKKLAMISAGLDISKSGYATCTSDATLARGYDVELTIDLLEFDNGKWNSIKSWTTTGSGILGASLDKSYWVAKGTYKVKATAVVTDANGNYIETATLDSTIEEYL